ncbi:MAG TPA: small multi-drug export protein [Kiritimatiellia bacterium]|nr:small multi-drug export protein [Kiritimatiellia bacterium]HPA77088.1 small multi-drug export protein [Kiritimatiellia bacterium]HQQ03354.1 small multi-drug export protein [Kiritimatiellia bacterium]
MKVQPGRLRQQIMLSEESSVFVLGSWMLIAWIAAITILWRMGHPSWMQWIIMGFTELFLGRGVAIAKAVEMGMHPGLIIFLATYVDAVTVFIFYPALILAYRNLLEGRFVDERMKGIIESAEKNVGRFAKYKIAGVFIFVWFPFFMTGVVVGAVLGYLLGLKTWTNMITVTVGTMSAAVCWMYAYDNLYGWLETIHPEIPLFFTVILIAGLAAGRLWMEAKKKRDLRKADQPHA